MSLAFRLWCLALAAPLALLSTPAAADLRYSGSDTVEPVIDAALVAFRRGNPAFKINRTSTGSSVGIRDLCGGRVAMAGASRPMKPEEHRDCEKSGVTATEIPVGIDAVVLIVSNKNPYLKDLKMSEVKQLFEPAAAGRLTSWKQVRSSLPDQPLRAVGVGIKHGTFEFFHTAIGNNMLTRSDIKDTVHHEETARIVAADPGAIGYVPLSVAKDFGAQVRMIALDFGDGPVEPTAQNVVAGRYGPLARIVYLYVNGAAVLKDGPESEAFVKDLAAGLERYVGFANIVALSSVQYQESARKASFIKR